MGYLAKLRVWRGNKEKGELVNYNVEVSEGEVLLDVIRASSSLDARVLDILETRNHPRANALTQYLIGLSKQGAGGTLISRGDFLSNFAES